MRVLSISSTSGYVVTLLYCSITSDAKGLRRRLQYVAYELEVSHVVPSLTMLSGASSTGFNIAHLPLVARVFHNRNTSHNCYGRPPAFLPEISHRHYSLGVIRQISTKPLASVVPAPKSSNAYISLIRSRSNFGSTIFVLLTTTLGSIEAGCNVFVYHATSNSLTASQCFQRGVAVSGDLIF